MTGQAPAYVRTNVPIAAGPIITLIASRLGLSLTVDEAVILAAVLSSAWYAVGRALESWHPTLGYVLGIAKQPAYSSSRAPSPASGEEVEAVVVPDEGLTLIEVCYLVIAVAVALLALIALGWINPHT